MSQIIKNLIIGKGSVTHKYAVKEIEDVLGEKIELLKEDNLYYVVRGKNKEIISKEMLISASISYLTNIIIEQVESYNILDFERYAGTIIGRYGFGVYKMFTTGEHAYRMLINFDGEIKPDKNNQAEFDLMLNAEELGRFMLHSMNIDLMTAKADDETA